jgi:hypothetical protein
MGTWDENIKSVLAEMGGYGVPVPAQPPRDQGTIPAVSTPVTLERGATKTATPQEAPAISATPAGIGATAIPRSNLKGLQPTTPPAALESWGALDNKAREVTGNIADATKGALSAAGTAFQGAVHGTPAKPLYAGGTLAPGGGTERFFPMETPANAVPASPTPSAASTGAAAFTGAPSAQNKADLAFQQTLGAGGDRGQYDEITDKGGNVTLSPKPVVRDAASQAKDQADSYRREAMAKLDSTYEDIRKQSMANGGQLGAQAAALMAGIREKQLELVKADQTALGVGEGHQVMREGHGISKIAHAESAKDRDALARERMAIEKEKALAAQADVDLHREQVGMIHQDKVERENIAAADKKFTGLGQRKDILSGGTVYDPELAAYKIWKSGEDINSYPSQHRETIRASQMKAFNLGRQYMAKNPKATVEERNAFVHKQMMGE